YLKINERCDVDEIENCFPEVILDSCGKELTTDDLKVGINFAAETSDTDHSGATSAVIFADGTGAVISYDKNCEWLDPYEGGANRSEAVQCVAILADVSGKKGKNTVGSDIWPINTLMGVEVDGLCWMLADVPYSAINTCSDATYDDTGTANDYCASNAWAGAKKACEDRGMSMPTNSQLLSLIQNYLYEDYYLDTSTTTTVADYLGTPVSENFEMLSLDISSLPFRLWSSSYDSGYINYGGTFYLTSTYFHEQWYTILKNSTSPYVRCVK
ncbi:MAG: hypothetical protein R3Y28_03635, partial [Candidatus Gastranaerophilales bacterium]